MSTRSTTELTEQLDEYTEKAWNDKEYDAVDDLFAETVTIHNVATGTDYDGRAAFKEWIRGVHEGFPDFTVEYTTDDTIVGEHKIAQQWTVSGTHEGTLPDAGIEATGNRVEFDGVTVFELDDGKVTEAWWYYDMLAFLDQLGLIPEEMQRAVA